MDESSEPVEPEPSKHDNDDDQSETGSVSGTLLQNLIFLNWVQYPPLPLVPDLSDPGAHGLGDYDVSHLMITTTNNARLGAWLMLPQHSSGRVEALREGVI